MPGVAEYENQGGRLVPRSPVVNPDGSCGPGRPAGGVAAPSGAGVGLGTLVGAAGVAGLFYLALGGKL